MLGHTLNPQVAASGQFFRPGSPRKQFRADIFSGGQSFKAILEGHKAGDVHHAVVLVGLEFFRSQLQQRCKIRVDLSLYFKRFLFDDSTQRFHFVQLVRSHGVQSIQITGKLFCFGQRFRERSLFLNSPNVILKCDNSIIFIASGLFDIHQQHLNLRHDQHVELLRLK